MHDLSVVASAFRVRLEGLADWVYGCTHRRTSFPLTLRAGVSVEGPQSTRSETYIVCLECGRHIAYDWSTMRVGSGRTALAWTRPGLDSIENKKDVTQERILPNAVKSGSYRGAEAHKECL
jgi:hypothetical protein